MRWIVAVVGLVGLCACPGSEDRPCPIVGVSFQTLRSVALDPRTGQFLVPGPVTLDLFPSALGFCPDGRQTFPEAVAVTVHAPDGQLLSARAELFDARAEVQFSAELPGWYHLEANFLPSYGLAQLDVLVTRPVTPQATTLDALCQRLDRTSQGAWICDQRVFRGAEQVDSLDESLFRWVGGAQVWTMGGGRVSRFTDTGEGPLVLTASGFSPSEEVLTGAVMGEDALLLRASQRLYRLQALADGGVSQTHSVALTVGEVLHLDGERVLADQFGEQGQLLQAYRLEEADAGFQPVGPPRVLNMLVGESPEGVWDSSQEAVRVFAAGENGVVTRAAATLSLDLFPQRQLPGPPWLMPSNGGAVGLFFTDASGGLEVIHLPEVPFLSGTGAGFGWVHESEKTRIFTW